MNIGVKLSRIRNEDFIWLIYIFIAIFAIISDYYEKDFLLHNNYESQKKFKKINIAILVVAFFIYLYFISINYKDMQELKYSLNKKEVVTSHVAFIAATLFLIGGILNILVEINRDTPIEDVGVI